jgi:hypothetical protein
MRILSFYPCGATRVLLHAIKSYDMGPSRFTSYPRGRCDADFYRPKESVALARFEPTTFGSSGKHTNHYTTKVTFPKLYFNIILPYLIEAVIYVIINLNFNSAIYCVQLES